MQETELEGGISLCLSLVLSLGNVHKLTQVMNGHLNVAILGMHISQQFVCLALLVSGTGFHLSLADLQETRQTCDRTVKVTKFFMDETNSLVAFGFLFFFVGTLTCLKTFFEVFEGVIELLSLLEINGNYLVHSDKLLGYGFFKVRKGICHTILMSCLHVVHGLKYVQHLLLANTETLQRIHFTSCVFVLNRNIMTSLVEVRGSLPII